MDGLFSQKPLANKYLTETDHIGFELDQLSPLSRHFRLDHRTFRPLIVGKSNSPAQKFHALSAPVA